LAGDTHAPFSQMSAPSQSKSERHAACARAGALAIPAAASATKKNHFPDSFGSADAILISPPRVAQKIRFKTISG
jgi:hypothetical protein